MHNNEDQLQGLLTRLADAQDGYREGAELSDDPMIVTLMNKLESTHGTHAQQVQAAMVAQGLQVGNPGSVMALVHKTIMNVRSLMSGLDEKVIPGIVDGEKRIVDVYDDLIAGLDDAGQTMGQLLTTQRETLVDQIVQLQRMDEAASIERRERS